MGRCPQHRQPQADARYSVYLFAEEAGNEATRLLSGDKIKTFIVIYYVGQGEWDSENYLGITSLHF